MLKFLVWILLSSIVLKFIRNATVKKYKCNLNEKCGGACCYDCELYERCYKACQLNYEECGHGKRGKDEHKNN